MIRSLKIKSTLTPLAAPALLAACGSRDDSTGTTLPRLKKSAPLLPKSWLC